MHRVVLELSIDSVMWLKSKQCQFASARLSQVPLFLHPACTSHYNSETMDTQALHEEFREHGWGILKGFVANTRLLHELGNTSWYVAHRHQSNKLKERDPYDGQRFNLTNQMNYECLGYLGLCYSSTMRTLKLRASQN